MDSSPVRHQSFQWKKDDQAVGKKERGYSSSFSFQPVRVGNLASIKKMVSRKAKKGLVDLLFKQNRSG
ncbi:hypothetical protein KFK09_006512 [Dendrobium nobile]|uniref:Uncharacterized protein n=1 Tax=Dendrobium nobile TaxID=94219 RepID=A0A8T3BPG9_DENNO|nr:hypothetical protein KFK09_006512 [Dendrobium nobile]